LDDENLNPEVENIPDADQVSRHIERPLSYSDLEGILWQGAFGFPGNAAESVCWHKYAPPPEKVHQLGKQREATKRLVKAGFGYVGFISSGAVGEIRAHSTANGHGFTVVHDPSGGQGLHHSEVSFRIADGAGKLSKGEKTDLRLAIQKYFGPLVPVEP
jgi:hypothetical protein